MFSCVPKNNKVKLAQNCLKMATFFAVPEKIDFPKEEEKILSYWRQIDAFYEAQRISKGRKDYNFYDGPPFATGMPHYGHILAGTIKDVVTRYAYQTGHYVDRRFGWDCHGLPVEFEIDKVNNITHRDQVLAMGIDVYNEKCRSIVMKYSTQWRDIVERTGRWIDFDKDYKTMDKTFMESVWWSFKKLFDKDLIYKSFKVMPYSIACSTPLSNFEANLNYKNVSDPSVIVAFKCGENDFLLIWTTTPWTLPSNMAIVVNPSLKYLKLYNKKKSQNWIVAECRLDYLLAETQLTNEDIEVISSFYGTELGGLRYEPIFTLLQERSKTPLNAYKVVLDNMVTTSTGTGLVHCAPYYGEEDFRVCMENGIIQKGVDLPCLIDPCGYFNSDIPNFGSKYFKDADSVIKNYLKNIGQLITNKTINHSYPFCWRSDTPLMYRAVSCWFVRVEEFREQIIKNTMQSNWVPSYVRDKRFLNWLSEAKDWCVSRNRFWGTPIPIWQSEDQQVFRCIGSIQELEECAIGNPKVTDLHRHFIDNIEIPDPRGPNYPHLRRIPEIFDCWYESGSMPYAKCHYPFEDNINFDNVFPADFVAEGLDQTRGWFYTLMILSTHLFDKPAFKNVIVNGLVLAEDGKKMSKRLSNYPDPLMIINKYGADSLRLYLISSVVNKGESLKFSENGIKNILKDVLLPWYHSYRFFVQQVTNHEVRYGKFKPNSLAPNTSDNLMDKWIYHLIQDLMKSVHTHLKSYELYRVTPKLLGFLENLTNWYIRLNRDRAKGYNGPDEALVTLQTMYYVLETFTRLMSPIVPFFSEMIYSNLKACNPEALKSVHFEMMPTYSVESDRQMLSNIETMQQIVVLGRILREKQKTPLKIPLLTLRVYTNDTSKLTLSEPLQKLIKDELNVMNIEFIDDLSNIKIVTTPNFKLLGKRLKNDMNKVSEKLKNLSFEEVEKLENGESLDVYGHEITPEDVVINRIFLFDSTGDRTDFTYLECFKGESSKELGIALDFNLTDELLNKAFTRFVSNGVQKLRKFMGLQHEDETLTYLSGIGDGYDKLVINKEIIETHLKRKVSLIAENELKQNGDNENSGYDIVETNYGPIQIQIIIK